MPRILCKICRAPKAGHCATCSYTHTNGQGAGYTYTPGRIACSNCACSAAVPDLGISFGIGKRQVYINQATDPTHSNLTQRVCAYVGIGQSPDPLEPLDSRDIARIVYQFSPEDYKFWRYMHDPPHIYHPEYILAMDNYKSSGHWFQDRNGKDLMTPSERLFLYFILGVTLFMLVLKVLFPKN